MTAWHLLVPVFLLCCVGSWLTYSPERRQTAWYPWVMVLLGALCSWLFATGAKWLNDSQRVYVFSLAWDLLMVAAYYVLPLVVLGVKVSPGVAAGAALVVAGLVVIKAWG